MVVICVGTFCMVADHGGGIKRVRVEYVGLGTNRVGVVCGWVGKRSGCHGVL